MNHIRQLLAALLALFLTCTLRAQVPALINYQGRAAVDGVNFDGVGQFKFALVNADASETFWSSGGASVAGSEPPAAVPLTVAKGLYSVLLGATSLGGTTIPLPSTVFSHPDVRLRVWFDDGVNGSQLLIPDQRLAPTGYLADGAVVSSTIADGAIVAAKIAPAAINGTHLAPGSLDFSHFAVPAAPGAGQVLGFDGAGLLWTAPGNGDGIWTLDGAGSAYRTIGNVGIGTSAPDLPLTLLTASNAYGLQHTDGTIRLATFLGGSAGGGWLGTVSNDKLNFFVNNGPARMTVDTTGSVGIGTTTPTSRFTVFTPSGGVTRVGMEHTDGTVRLGTYATPGLGGQLGTISNHELNLFANNGPPSLTLYPGGAVSMSGGSAGSVTIGSPNGESGLSIQAAGNRADVRFDGSALKLVAGPIGGPPASINGIAVSTNGNVGIGTIAPTAKLQVVGNVSVTGDLTATGRIAANDGATISSPPGGGLGALTVFDGANVQAAYFRGQIQITGSVVKGGGSFKIDHPLDPAGKYLSHSFVESPDMMNIYNGNIALDEHGEATVVMPDWFSALNRDFRYQLTAMGGPGPNLHVAVEMAHNSFKIAGGHPSQKVSWQVTGIRHDAWANVHRIPVEETKKAEEHGSYLHPGEFGQPAEKAIGWRRQEASKQQPATPPIPKSSG